MRARYTLDDLEAARDELRVRNNGGDTTHASEAFGFDPDEVRAWAFVLASETTSPPSHARAAGALVTGILIGLTLAMQEQTKLEEAA